MFVSDRIIPYRVLVVFFIAQQETQSRRAETRNTFAALYSVSVLLGPYRTRPHCVSHTVAATQSANSDGLTHLPRKQWNAPAHGCDPEHGDGRTRFTHRVDPVAVCRAHTVSLAHVRWLPVHIPPSDTTVGAGGAGRWNVWNVWCGLW